jgi:hypothetical protein
MDAFVHITRLRWRVTNPNVQRAALPALPDFCRFHTNPVEMNLTS